MTRPSFSLTCLVLMVSLAAFPLAADDTAVQGSGGVIQPMAEHPSIVMQDMDVHIGITFDHALVNCTFIFRNEGAETTVKMGFPERGILTADSTSPRGFTTFRTWVDGREVYARIEGLKTYPEGAWRRWRTKTVHFEAGQTRRVEVEYQTPLGEVSDGSRLFEYEVQSGGSWKGPIEHVSIHLYLSPDRQGGTYTVPVRFAPAGEDAYLWTASNLEPTAQHDVKIVYHPPRLRLVGGDGLVERSLPLTPYFTQRPIHVPVTSLAALLGAEFTQDHRSATLVYGTHTVTVRIGSQWADLDGRRQRLVMQVRRERGAVVVPIMLTMMLMQSDADFDTDWKHHTFRFTLPIHRALTDCLGRERARAALKLLRETRPGWGPVEKYCYTKDALDFSHREGLPAPWYCCGDFNGDGFSDIALLLCKGEEIGVALVESVNDRSFRFRWLQKPFASKPLVEHHVSTVLRARHPGIVRHWLEGPEGSASPEGRLDLEHDAIEVIGEKAAVIYYLDENAGDYRQVVTGD